MHVGRGFHVAADPGAKAHDHRQFHALRRHAVQLAQRRGDLLVERRNDGVENFDQVENRMLALVGHRQALARMFLGLPVGVDLGPDAL